eukprot:10322076-Prorocentrum_lima.AAC.1
MPLLHWTDRIGAWCTAQQRNAIRWSSPSATLAMGDLDIRNETSVRCVLPAAPRRGIPAH